MHSPVNAEEHMHAVPSNHSASHAASVSKASDAAVRASCSIPACGHGELLAIAHRKRLQHLVNGNLEGLQIALSQPYPLDESDLIEALAAGRSKALVDI